MNPFGLQCKPRPEVEFIRLAKVQNLRIYQDAIEYAASVANENKLRSAESFARQIESRVPDIDPTVAFAIARNMREAAAEGRKAAKRALA